ncbi:hypothetical protein BH10PSE13_BH10PSE13_22400 [soil metagenome]
MIEILESPDHVGAYKLVGTLAGEDVDRVIADVEARLGRHGKIGVLADLTEFEDMGVRAGLKDLRYSFGKILQWHRFPKEAVITDKQWMRSFASLASPLIPFVTLKAFAPEERVAAFAWVGSLEHADKTRMA